MKKKSLLIIIIALVAILSLFFLFEKQQPDKTIKIGYKEHIGYLPLFVAYDNSYFDDENIKVETIKFESTDLMVKALISGDLDVLIGINTLTAFAAEQASPNKLKIFTGQVYTTEEYADEIIVSKDSELSSIQDLRGKKIGLMPGSGFTEFMKIILEKNNLSENDVELSQMESKILLQALANKNIDAVLALEPLGTMAAEKNIGRQLIGAPFARYIINPFPIAVGVVRSDFSKQNFDKLTIATDKAIDFIRQNSRRSKEIASKWTNMDLNTTLKIKLNRFEKLEEMDKAQLQKVADLYVEFGLIDKPINISNMFREK